MYYEVGVTVTFGLSCTENECQENRFNATDYSGSEKQLSQGTLPHTTSSTLSMWMMTQLDSAASVCHHLPTSNHDGEKKSPRLPTTKYSHTFSHPCEHEQTPFSITKNFLGQMLISYGSGFKSSSLSFSLFLNHKSFNSAAQTVLVSPLFPLDTMRINYIKAGLVNLAGVSCKRH